MTDRSTHHATFIIERTFEAPPARVFAAWADPAAKNRWFVTGEGWDLAEYEHEFRVGGREHGRFRRQGGPTYRNDTVYQDIVPDRRILFAYTMAREDTRISASLTTVELLPEGMRTRLVLTEQGAFLDREDRPEFREEGWSELMDALGAELRREPATA
jgi:uncharacterized protein YndB with AHSA1/START domain